MTDDPFAMLADALQARDAPWRHRAACRGLPTAWFFPDKDAEEIDRRAAAACASCPVRNECWADGKHEDYGVWAGEPVKVRKQRRPIPQHGTESGYVAHRRRGEDACAACKAARSRANLSRRKAGAA